MRNLRMKANRRDLNIGWMAAVKPPALGLFDIPPPRRFGALSCRSASHAARPQPWRPPLKESRGWQHSHWQSETAIPPTLLSPTSYIERKQAFISGVTSLVDEVANERPIREQSN
jgi:hypothetical protein